MPLTPEQIERIEQEEQQRIAEELGHTRAARRATPVFGNGVRLVALFLMGFALASLFIAWQWQPGDTRPTADSKRARTPSKDAPAVFGEKPAAPLPDDPALLRQTDVPDERQRTADAATVPADILRFVERWERTLENSDLEGQAACYAPVVERFYTKSNVRLNQVIDEKRRMLETYPNFHKYEIANIRVHSLTPQRAAITFDKTWDTSGRTRFAGSEQQRLVLVRIGGQWKIVREEETRVYWVRRT